MPSLIRHHYWYRQEPVARAVSESLRKDFADAPLVVDVGAGYDPWPPATELVDIRKWTAEDPRPVHIVDIEEQRLPYADQKVDFVYTRHTLEDIHSPLQLCAELNRIGKAGYIETPSPLAEFCRGVDAGKPPFRGYIHHRHFIWEEEGVLHFLPKYPVVEHIEMEPEQEERLAQLLNENPLFWNTYLLWKGAFKFRLLRHDVDFTLQESYGNTIMRAVNASIASARRFAVNHGIGRDGFRADA